MERGSRHRGKPQQLVSRKLPDDDAPGPRSGRQRCPASVSPGGRGGVTVGMHQRISKRLRATPPLSKPFHRRTVSLSPRPWCGSGAFGVVVANSGCGYRNCPVSSLSEPECYQKRRHQARPRQARHSALSLPRLHTHLPQSRSESQPHSSLPSTGADLLPGACLHAWRCLHI